MFIRVTDSNLDISVTQQQQQKQGKKPILPKVNFNQLSDTKKCLHPSRSLILLRIPMGILFGILVTAHTHTHFSYAISILK